MRLPVFLLVAVGAACVGPLRRLPTHDNLLRDAEVHHDRVEEQRERLTAAMLERVLHEDGWREGHDPVFDILMLSGGGQYGAFGAGILRGWGEVADHEHVRPEFDVVTGVSTGSLIAPFAFAGSAHEIERVERFYREVGKELAVLRGMLFFLPWRDSFFDITGLQETLDEEIGHEELVALREGHAGHRRLLVATTNIDLGVMRIWDLGHEVTGLDDQEALERIRRILRASAAIPAAFPPVEIDGHLHVDGGVAESLFLHIPALEEAVHALRQRVVAPPRVRLWAVVNGKISPGIQPTGLTWPSVAARSSRTATHLALATELRRIELFARWLATVAPWDVEFRYLALPEDFEIPPADGANLFDAELMNRLADLGEELGRDPASWRTDPPHPEMLTSGHAD